MVTAQFDTYSIDHLRTVAGIKWSLFPDCIGAWVAEMDFGTAPPIQDALREVVDNGIFGYTRPSDVTRMQEAIVAWNEREYGWTLPAERIRPILDVITGLEAAIRHFSAEGTKVVVSTPAYMPFLTVPKMLGREIIEVPMLRSDESWSWDFDALDRAMQDAGKGALFILCNPSNPVGRVFRKDELEALAEVIDRNGGRVFSDEIHAPIVYPGGTHLPYASLSETTANHTVTSASASKAWNLAGLKCAQLVLTNEADAAKWKEMGFLVEHGAAPMGIIANAVAFSEGKPWLDEVLAYLDGNRRLLVDLLAEHLPEARYIMPEGTYLTWIDLSAYQLPGDLGVFFRENAKVAVVDGKACGGCGAGAIRFNIAMSRDLLSQAIEQMGKAVAAHPR
ncbi:MAG: aminotransferase class I/II-fold pyridoxal phosphate-dependent enzyme [Thermomicrobiales bacterium]|nr:aminotransferase class I/II-fold pyridoxal phosphate-dependent enzyme [Thermomicrobiales bacterium]